MFACWKTGKNRWINCPFPTWIRHSQITNGSILFGETNNKYSCVDSGSVFFLLTLGKLKSPREKKFNIKTMPTPGTIAISLLSTCVRSSCISPSPNQYIVPVPRDLKTHMSIEKYGKYVDVWEKKMHGHFTMYIKNIFSKNYLLQLILLNYAKIVCRTEEGHSAFEAALHDTWMLLHEIPSQTRAIQYIL